MGHLSFLYYSIAYSVGFPAIAVVAMAYARTGERALRSYLLFLGSVTLQLICVALLRYEDMAILGGRTAAVSRHVYFFIESTLILSLPPFCHNLLAVPKAEVKNRLFGILFLFCAATIASPFFVRYSGDGTALRPLVGFYLYRLLFFAVMAYCIFRLGSGLRRLQTKTLRAFAGFALSSLLFSLWEMLHCELLPLLGGIPPTIPLSPAGYLVTNILLTVYVIRTYLGSPRTEASGDRFEAALAASDLSTREKEIVSLLVQGLRNKEIGELLFISDSTVKTHIKSVYRKLDVGNRVELMNALGKRG